MAKTEVTGKQIKDGSVQRDDVDIVTAGQAVTRKIIAGTLISLSQTGVDAGTGDVTVSVNSPIPIANGGTGQITAQAAINVLSNVAGATNEHVLTKDTISGNAIWKAASGGGGSGGPVGSILPWGGAAAPSGYLLCDGSAISRTTFADLFAAIGVAFGVGDGSTTFNIPDLRGRFPLGKAVSGTGSVLGGVGGSLDHSHTIAHTHNMANHTHTIAHTHSINDHVHNAGGLRANIGVNLASAGDGIRMVLDGGQTFTSSFRWTASGVGFVGDGTGGHPSTTLFGNTAGSGVLNTNASSAPNSGGPSTNVTDGSNTANSGTNNPAFQVVNFVIKYTNNVFDATGGITYTPTTYTIKANTTDGSDNAIIRICGGGDVSNTRGGYITLSGNENADAGAVKIISGGSASVQTITNGNVRQEITSTGLIQTRAFTGYTPSGKFEIPVVLNTTTNTPTNIYTLTLADNTTYHFSVSIAGRFNSTTAKGIGGKLKFIVYRNNAGVATIAADLGGRIKEIDTYGTSGYDFDVDVSGNDVRISVTGGSGETVSWIGNVEYIVVSTSA